MTYLYNYDNKLVINNFNIHIPIYAQKTNVKNKVKINITSPNHKGIVPVKK